ncbi:SDR family oxidoreductase [Candidatus Peregrinibacteria bacterium]|nr:SDR family oxidoreductase [Candidatus Peregrinibacteria bacterium]
MKILVTGSLGYIGAVLMPKLEENGYEAKGIDLGWYASDDAAQWIDSEKKDFRDLTSEDLKGFDAIVHLAGLSNDPMGELDQALTEEINYKGTVELARRAKEAKVKRFIFSSSCSVYGISQGEKATEESELNPLTAYAKSKINSELGLAPLADENFSPVYLRNATIYGDSPALRFDLVLNNLVGSALTTDKIVILSDGTPWRPLVHVDDVCQAIIETLKAPREKIHDQAFNVGNSDGNYQVKSIAEAVHEILPSCEVTFGEQTSPDKRDYCVSFEKIQKVLPSFKPQWNLQKGASQIAERFKGHGLDASDFKGPRYVRIERLKQLINEDKLTPNLTWK